ncbi:hypothetical protein M9Y10_031791 [Tritrichomonas musculus]|uniref:beta-galactosidase n=1 Tax=Tritrichomonas musculus TaxID=1915356 RepID=A0ABR2GZR9_9EUKA
MSQIPYYKDIKTVAVNKEQPRTTFLSHDTREEALNNVTDYEKSPYYINLNGKWEFYYNDYPKNVPADIATNTNNNDPSWGEINVPGNWEVQGHGVAKYTNIVYDFCPSNPHPPNLPEFNPVGVYRRKDIGVPQEWIDQGRDIFLQVGGAKTGLYVYINGVEVGYSEDSKDPADFLINKYIHKGNNNVLTFLIYKYCTGSYLEDQDMWRLGGIERDIVIYSQPKTHIRDFKVVSTLDDSYTNGILRLTTNVINHSEKADVVLSYELVDVKDNKKVVSQGQLESSLENDQEKVVTFNEATLKNVKKWSAEHPNLYTLLLTLKKKGDNSILEVVSVRVGFRREEMSTVKFNGKSYPVLLFNGEPVIYKGVNVHEHNEKTGHYVTDEIRLKDIELLKTHNFNAIRCCHYPNCRRFYELCDEYGFYVFNECNIESHGMGYDLSVGGTLANDPDWYEAHIERTKNMYERTKNFACITFLSLANEAGNGYNFYLTYKYLKENEVNGQNRPVVYERAEWEWNTDMFVPMYPKADWFEEKGENSSDRPIMPCEYSHAMGNSNGNFDRIWKAIYKYPNLQGGFIWDWVDQGILETGKGGRKYWTYGGDYGENSPSDGNFNINGCVNPDRDPHPAMAEFKYSQQEVGFEPVDIENGIVRITNRFFFTDLSNYEVIATIAANEKVVKEINLSSTNKELSSLAPQKSIEINLHSEVEALKPQVNTEYFLNFKVLAKTDKNPFIPKGFEVAHDQYRLPIEPSPKAVQHETGPELTISSTEESVIVSSKKVEFVFSKSEGVVKSFKVDGVEYISESFGFQPNFWRPPNDNDYGNGGPLREQVWKTMSHNFKVEKCHSFVHNNVASLCVVYQLVDNNKFEVLYLIYGSGVVKVNANYIPSNEGKLPNIPRIGLRFRVPKEMNNVVYFGRGPEENYADRCNGTQIGLYRTTAEDLYYPYVRPQENGHHIDTRWLAVHQANSNGLLIAADSLIEFNVLRNSVEDFDSEDQTSLRYQYNCFDEKPQEGKNILRRQHHIDDIVPRDYVEVNVDLKQQGVAGFDSWGDKVLPEFTLPANQNYSYGFTLAPIHNENEISEKLNHL